MKTETSASELKYRLIIDDCLRVQRDLRSLTQASLTLEFENGIREAEGMITRLIDRNTYDA